MILYEKFGYEVRLLTEENGPELFRFFADGRFTTEYRRKLGMDAILSERDHIKATLRYALFQDHFNSVGLFKDGKIVGISFNSVDHTTGVPWLGYFKIAKEQRRGKAYPVLMNYVLNHLYKGKVMRLKSDMNQPYSKYIRVLPLMIEYSVITPELFERVQRICGETPEPVDKGE